MPLIIRKKSQNGTRALLRQSGSSLIEVMISVFILSTSMLGLAGMEITAKRSGYDALQRSQATNIANDIVERMRSNSGTLDSYVAANIGNGSIGAEPSPNCGSEACTVAQLASHDLWEWEQALDGAAEKQSGVNAGGLNFPQACITHSAGVVTVAIAWKGSQETSNPTASSCGNSSGFYGTGNSQRLLMVFQTYINDL